MEKSKQVSRYSIRTHYFDHTRTHSLRFYSSYNIDIPKGIKGSIDDKNLSHAKLILKSIRSKYPNIKLEIIKTTTKTVVLDY